MDPYISFLLNIRNRHFLALDFLIFLATPTLALLLRTDAAWPLSSYAPSLLVITAVFAAIKLALFYRAGLYSRYWRYASIDELGVILVLSIIALMVQSAVFFLVLQPFNWIGPGFPRSVPIIEGLLSLLAIGGLRFSVPLAERLHTKRHNTNNKGERVIVAGARTAGMTIVQEMMSNASLGVIPVAFVDDDVEKQGMRIRGVPVLGTCADIAKVCQETDANKVIIAMPNARGRLIREIVTRCEEAGVQTKIIPGVHEMLNGSVSIKQMRDIKIEDLLRREPVETDTRSVRELIKGKRVLVTGGGGSIGSELCRQVLQFDPETLIILGHGENSVFEIHNELLRKLEQEGRTSERSPRVLSVIADIRFLRRLRSVFQEYKPDVVFHAAAHKHVPLMEVNPVEAITNNVIGTRNLLEVSQEANIQQFVLISTDKAVNPTSVMGASKRVAELLVHQAAERSGKHYLAVRFGNVLGSRGSVVLTFQQQIAAGGPVTITHPEMRRFFMTIPEAVQLVLQSAALGDGGEVFMLDMGEPVRIVDLAHDLIRLTGLNGRIDISFTGLRPGEKLYEEMFTEGEQYERTRHEKIFIARNASSFVSTWLDRGIVDLEVAVDQSNNKLILQHLKGLVPEFSQGGTAGTAVKVPVQASRVQAEPARPFVPLAPGSITIPPAIGHVAQ